MVVYTWQYRGGIYPDIHLATHPRSDIRRRDSRRRYPAVGSLPARRAVLAGYFARREPWWQDTVVAAVRPRRIATADALIVNIYDPENNRACKAYSRAAAGICRPRGSRIINIYDPENKAAARADSCAAAGI